MMIRTSLGTAFIAGSLIAAVFVTAPATEVDVVYYVPTVTVAAEPTQTATAVATRQTKIGGGEAADFIKFVLEPAPPLPPTYIGWESWLRKAEVPESAWSAVTVVARCESRIRSDMIGDGGSSIGSLQIQPFAGGQHLWRLGELGYPLDPDLLFDPVINLRVGMHITSNGLDWWAFSCQPDGTIKKW